MFTRLLITLFFSATLHAETSVDFSGFATLGVVTSNSDTYGWRADFSRPEGAYKDELDFSQTSKIGLQMDAVFNNEFDAVVQVLYRDQNDLDLDSAVNIAFLRYSPTPNWSFRVGRTAWDIFLLTEYRDIDFGYSWAHVPTETYGVVPYRYVDGGDVKYTLPLGEWSLGVNLYAGSSSSDFSSYVDPDTINVDIKDIRGISVDIESFDIELGVNYSASRLNTTATLPIANALLALNAGVPGFEFIFPDAMRVAEQLTLEESSTRYYSLNARYRGANYTISSELSRTLVESFLVPDVSSGYLSAEYHWDNHTGFISYSRSESQTSSIADLNVQEQILFQIPGAELLYLSIDALLGYYNLNQNTISVGWRWDVKENVAFKLQLDTTSIGDQGSTIFQRKNVITQAQASSDTVNTLFANVSFIF